MEGRVGDSPLVGAGVYADNAACAVSGTGSGEHFIRAVLAHEVAARMRHRGDSLAIAARRALAVVAALGGEGGLIAVDRAGHVRHVHFGESSYGETETLIRRLLNVRGPRARAMADTTPTHLITPESYLGYDRLDRANQELAQEDDRDCAGRQHAD